MICATKAEDADESRDGVMIGRNTRKHKQRGLECQNKTDVLAAQKRIKVLKVGRSEVLVVDLHWVHLCEPFPSSNLIRKDLFHHRGVKKNGLPNARLVDKKTGVNMHDKLPVDLKVKDHQKKKEEIFIVTH